MRAHLEALAIDQWQIADVLSACGEAVLNVIEHAYSHLPSPGDLNVTTLVTDHSISVTVVDQGVWKNQAPRMGRSHGFEMMRGVAGKLSVKSDAEGTVIYMSFPLAKSGKSLLQAPTAADMIRTTRTAQATS